MTTASPDLQHLVSMPSLDLFRRARDLATPALVYDLDGVRDSVHRVQRDLLALPGARLNLAVKSCHTPSLLRTFADLGLGADVASLGELRLATEAGFDEISATGPSFSGPDAFAELQAAGVTLDVDSLPQLDAWGRWSPDGAVGLRIRMPLPESVRGDSTFGEESRFGIAVTDPTLEQLLERHGCRITRLHVHTGQMTPEALVYKVRYLLAVARVFPEVDLIDVGGGFFHLYADRSRAQVALLEVRRLVDDFTAATGRSIQLRFEPGGALLAPYGHLFVTALSVEDPHPGLGIKVVTVDASAWNLTPWHKGQVLLADPDADASNLEPARVAGNTLYENDFFGTDVLGRTTAYSLPPCAAGQRLVITACGAYSITNSRRFHRLELPDEYLFDARDGMRQGR